MTENLKLDRPAVCQFQSPGLPSCCWFWFWLTTLSVALTACAKVEEESDGAHTALARADVKRWKLPSRLKEISALALDRKGRLFALADEDATLYQLDYDSGKIIGELYAGEIRGDFEGLAVANGRFYLITSQGKLIILTPGQGAEPRVRRLDTDLGKNCEIEGLTYSRTDDTLLIACKQPILKALQNRVVLFKWSVSREHSLPEQTLFVPLPLITEKIGSKDFNPSAVSIDPINGHIILVASRQRAWAELDPQGQLLQASPLPSRKHHRQPEGLVITDKGDIILADEGGKGKARLTIYPWPLTSGS